jgi:hypothetical protein
MKERLVGGKYRLVSELGTDPVFESYTAVDEPTARNVLLRLLKPDAVADEAFIEELIEASERLKGVEHTGVDRVYEVVEREGEWLAASRHDKGSFLIDRLDRLTSFSVPVALSTAVGIVDALSACHDAGIIHGDISPRNVFVRQDESIVLLSPGFWTAYAKSPKIAREFVPLIAPYLAPEVTAGDEPSEQSDVYAVGALLYELLTGEPPYDAGTTGAMARLHASAEIPSVRAFAHAAPPALDELIVRCLAKSPESRPDSAAELLADLKWIQDAVRFGRSLDARPSEAKSQPSTARPAAVRKADAALASEREAKEKLQAALKAESEAKAALQEELKAETEAKAALESALKTESEAREAAKRSGDLAGKQDLTRVEAELKAEAEAKQELEAKLAEAAAAQKELESKLSAEAGAKQKLETDLLAAAEKEASLEDALAEKRAAEIEAARAAEASAQQEQENRAAKQELEERLAQAMQDRDLLAANLTAEFDAKASLEDQLKTEATARAELEREAKEKGELEAQLIAEAAEKAQLIEELKAKSRETSALAEAANEKQSLAESLEQASKEKAELEAVLAREAAAKQALEAEVAEKAALEEKLRNETDAKAKLLEDLRAESEEKAGLAAQLDDEAKQRAELLAEAKVRSDLELKLSDIAAEKEALEAELSAQSQAAAALKAESEERDQLQLQLTAESEAKASLEAELKAETEKAGKLEADAQKLRDLEAKLKEVSEAKLDLETALHKESKTQADLEEEVKKRLELEAQLLEASSAKAAIQDQISAQTADQASKEAEYRAWAEREASLRSEAEQAALAKADDALKAESEAKAALAAAQLAEAKATAALEAERTAGSGALEALEATKAAEAEARAALEAAKSAEADARAALEEESKAKAAIEAERLAEQKASAKTTGETQKGGRDDLDKEERKLMKAKMRSERRQTYGVPAWLAFMGYLSLVSVCGVVGWWFYQSNNAAKEITMPDLLGLSLREASTHLKSMDLNIKQSREEPSDQPKGTVIKHSPAPGKAIKERSFVMVVVSSGSRFVESPSLTGKTLDEAKSILEMLGLDLFQPLEYESSRTVDKGRIISQSPEAKESLPRSSKVRVKVSLGPRASRPDVYNFRMTMKMPEGEFDHFVRVEIVDGMDTRDVHHELYSPGDVFVVNAQGFGPTAEFIIYFDGEEIRRETVTSIDADPNDLPDEASPPSEDPIEVTDEENTDEGVIAT